MYASVADPVTPLWRLTPSGALDRTFDAGSSSGINAFDLASDQCTVYFSSETASGVAAAARVQRYDVCTAAALPDFVTMPSRVRAIRITPAGGILFATDAEIRLYSASAALVRAYPLAGESGFVALAISADGGSFWVATAARHVIRVSSSSGAVERGPVVVNAPGTIASIAVVGEPRASAASTPPAVPLSGAAGLIVLAVLILAAGVGKLA